MKKLRHPGVKNAKSQGRGRFGLFFAGWLALGVGVVAAAVDPLTAGEREWLQENQPIRFVSQTTYPPFEFIDSEGQRQGMCLDLVRWMSQEIGFQVEFQDMAFQQAQDAVIEGRADVITSLFYSEKRDLRFDFTPMMWEVPATIFVRSERPDIVKLNDLRGKRIAIQRGDYAEEFLKSKDIHHKVVSVDSFAEAADRILAGKADAMIGDRSIVLHHLFSRGLAHRMKSVGEPLYAGHNAMAVKEGNVELLGILTKGMELAREQGVFEALVARWLGTPVGEAPSRWKRNPFAMAVGLGMAAAIPLVLLLWIFHLRRILARRTVELREAQDAHKSIILSRPWRLLLVRSLLLISLLIPLGFAANHILNRYVIMPGYLALEQKEAQRALNGALDVIRREAGHLENSATDWAFGDDTYAFVLDQNPAYVTANLNGQSLSEQSQIDVILLYDSQGNRLWKEAYDPFRNQSISLDDFSRGALPEDHALLRHPKPNQASSGLWLTELGPMLVASCAILPTDLKGPSRGTLVVGRFLREAVLDDMSTQLGVEVGISDPRNPTLTEKQAALFSHLAPSVTQVEETSPDRLTGYVLMADLEGRPALLFTLGIPRDIVQQGRATARLLSWILFEFILIILIGTAISFIYSFREAFRRQSHVERLVEARTKALQDTEGKWKSYVDSAPMGIFISDFSGRFQEINPAACRMAGYTERELRGKTLSDLLPPECHEEENAYFRQAVEQGAAAGEFRFLNRKGEKRWLTVSAVRLNDQRVLEFTEDITDRRKDEEARESLQNMLNQAQKMESIGRLAGGVAHDFNNMLGVILGFTELGLDSVAAGEPLHDGLLEIHKAATRSAALTRQLLAFARKQTVLPRALDLNVTVEGMLVMLRRLIGEHVELTWRPGTDAGSVMMDPSQIDQILVNLCVNARDALGEQGKIAIETGLVIFDEDTCERHPGAILGEYVQLAVSDNGCGMDDETLAHIFEPFFSTKVEASGTGLGLATVYGVVKQNRGFISVQSERNKGSTFIIYLPRHGEPIPVAPAKDRKTAPQATRHETILLVEDEPAHLNMTCAMLGRQGYTMLPASSPREAIRLARDHSGEIDLLLTDVVMPEMNGHDLARTVIALRPGIKRLFMSGYTADVIAHQGVLDQGVCFLQKPFTIPELTAKILEALEH